MHVPVGQQPFPGFGKRFDQVTFVQADDRLDLLGLCRNQRPRQLVVGERRLGRNQDQHLVQVGRKRFGADLVLPVEQVAAGFDLFDRAFVLGGLPQHPVTHHTRALLATRMADHTAAFGCLYQEVAAVVGHDQALVKGGALRRRSERGRFTQTGPRYGSRSQSRWPTGLAHRGC